MRAIIQDTYGTADVLRLGEIDPPAIDDNQVLVRVHAAGVDPSVWHLMTGLPYLVRIMGYGFRRPKQRVPGSDVAGQVEAVGSNVTRFRPGDEVFGTAAGTFAEFARAKETSLAPKPHNLSFTQAAAVPISALTALQGLRDVGRLTAGQSVLVIGASGGVGSYAVQLARALGATVTGVCSTSKAELVRSLGADHVIDYTQAEITDSGVRYDLILDTAGNRPLSLLRRALTPRGTLVFVGGEGGGRVLGIGRQLLGILLSPFIGQQFRMYITQMRVADLMLLKDMVEAGTVIPVIDQTFPLPEAADAIRRLAEGHARGKMVIQVRDPQLP